MYNAYFNVCGNDTIGAELHDTDITRGSKPGPDILTIKANFGAAGDDVSDISILFQVSRRDSNACCVVGCFGEYENRRS
jgi:hypothetical protein